MGLTAVCKGRQAQETQLHGGGTACREGQVGQRTCDNGLGVGGAVLVDVVDGLQQRGKGDSEPHRHGLGPVLVTEGRNCLMHRVL